MTVLLVRHLPPEKSVQGQPDSSRALLEEDSKLIVDVLTPLYQRIVETEESWKCYCSSTVRAKKTSELLFPEFQFEEVFELSAAELENSWLNAANKLLKLERGSLPSAFKYLQKLNQMGERELLSQISDYTNRVLIEILGMSFSDSNYIICGHGTEQSLFAYRTCYSMGLRDEQSRFVLEEKLDFGCGFLLRQNTRPQIVTPKGIVDL
jgi:hypothetical protein